LVCDIALCEGAGFALVLVTAALPPHGFGSYGVPQLFGDSGIFPGSTLLLGCALAARAKKADNKSGTMTRIDVS
jgi:hypothetical protein